MPRRPQRRLPLSERIKDGRVYHKSGMSPTGIIYLRCRSKHLCHGTAKISNNNIVETTAHSPYCPLDEFALQIARFKEVMRESLAHHWYGLRELYDTTALIHPEAAANVSFRSVRSFMVRCRRNVYPPHPQNLGEFAEKLLDPQYARNLEYQTGRGDITYGHLSVKLITDGRNNNHVLLYDEEFVQGEMRDVDRLFIDGTFRTTPNINDATQLVTILGIKLNHGFPFMWVIMSSKTQISYTSVLSHIKEHVLPPTNNIKLVMSDFERGLRNAIVQVFPQAHSTGCNTHYDRALCKKANALGLHHLLRDNADAKLFSKNIMALAYLPSALIEGQYIRLKNNLAPNLMRRFRPFCQYYERYWIQIVTPHGFSVYGLGRRTNNVIESYHSRLRHKLEAHPAPWDFICKLLKLQCDAKADIGHLKNNRQIGRHARYSTIHKQKHLLRAWRELHMREITVVEFLEKATNLKGNVSQMIERERIEIEDPIEDEFQLQEPPAAIPLENDPDYEEHVFADDPPVWLIDNAPLAAENDIPESFNGESDGSLDSFGDEEVVHDDEERAPLPIVIDEEIPPLFEIGRPNDEGRQTPPAIAIDIPESIYGESDGSLDSSGDEEVVHDDEERAPLPIVIDEEIPPLFEIGRPNDEGRQTPPAIAIDNEVPLLWNVEFPNYVGQQPPPDIIDNVVSLPRNEPNAEFANEVRRQQPPPPDVGGHRRRNRQRRRRGLPVAPAEPASSKNQKRNRRRQEMRNQSAVARHQEIEQLRNEAAQAEALRIETTRLQAQLAEAQQQLQSAENNRTAGTAIQTQSLDNSH